MEPDEHVADDAHVVEQPDVLKGARQALAVDDDGRQPGDALAVQHDFPLGGLVNARQHIEHGGLARAVRADQPVDLIFSDLKVEAVYRLQAAERNAEVFRL